MDEFGELVHLRAHARLQEILDPLSRVLNLALQLHFQNSMREMRVLAGAEQQSLITPPVLRNSTAGIERHETHHSWNKKIIQN